MPMGESKRKSQHVCKRRRGRAYGDHQGRWLTKQGKKGKTTKANSQKKENGEKIPENVGNREVPG